MPKRYAIFLRGVNVGKGNTLPMARLRSMLTDAGAAKVATYLQSGNAVFETQAPLTQLVRDLGVALKNEMGRPIDTAVRSEAEMGEILAVNPFPPFAAFPKNLCVTFLSAEPSSTVLAPLVAVDFAPEAYACRGRHLYTWHPQGQGVSALAKAMWKLKFHGTVTTRNWSTVANVRAMLQNFSPHSS